MKCSKVLKNGSTCRNNTKENSFFCPKHYETMYEVNDFYLLHMVQSIKTLRKILRDGSVKANSLTNNALNGLYFDTIFMYLLSPDDRIVFNTEEGYIILNKEVDKMKDRFYRFKHTHLVFKPEILMYADSHISMNWNYGKMNKESEIYRNIEGLSPRETLRENLNLWNEKIKFYYPEITARPDHRLTTSEVVIKTEIIDLSYMKAIYYPKNIYDIEACTYEHSVYRKEFKSDYTKHIKSYMKLYEKYKDIYRWILNGNKSFLRKYIYEIQLKPWLDVDPTPTRTACIEKVKKSALSN